MGIGGKIITKIIEENGEAKAYLLSKFGKYFTGAGILGKQCNQLAADT